MSVSASSTSSAGSVSNNNSNSVETLRKYKIICNFVYMTITTTDLTNKVSYVSKLNNAIKPDDIDYSEIDLTLLNTSNQSEKFIQKMTKIKNVISSISPLGCITVEEPTLAIGVTAKTLNIQNNKLIAIKSKIETIQCQTIEDVVLYLTPEPEFETPRVTSIFSSCVIQ